MKYGIGQPVRRREDVRLVSGKGRYTDDITLPGEAHAYFVRSPHAHARILGIDASAALKAPGVIGVITAADIVGTGVMPVRGPLKNRDGSEQKLSPKMALPADKVRFAGEPVAMVVAQTAAEAKDAIELVSVDYEALGAAVTLATARNAPPVWDHAPGNLCFDWQAGDKAACDAAFDKAARVVSVDVRQNRLAPNPMEPRGAIGDYDKATGRYTLYTGTQGTGGMRERMAGAILKIPQDRLRVVNDDVGGGFGQKTAVAPELALVLIAAKTFGRPVKWIGERIESIISDSHGRDVHCTAQMALDADARILAVRIKDEANLGAYLTHAGPNVPTAGLRVFGGVYRVPTVYARVEGFFTNTSPVSAYRGAGRPEAIYLTERLMDAAADAFGLDRIEIRRRNLLTKDELPYKNWWKLSIDSGDFIANLDEAARRADWAGFETRRLASEARGLKRGRGVAYYMEASGGPPGPEQCRVLFRDGGVHIYLATQSNGQGHETVYAQVASELLGVPYESVTIHQGDSDENLSGGGTVGSRSMQTAGSSVTLAAKAIIAKGKAAAAHVLQAGGADVEFANVDGEGRFWVAGTNRFITMSDLASTLAQEKLPGFENGLDEGAAFDSPPTFPNGCHICEVEIDPETGRVAIGPYVIVDDVGIVLNPLLVDGQIHGGVAQGLGQVLMEECVYDETSGQMLSATFADYAMPHADDMPKLDISFNEVPCVTNPLGVKGAGEAGTIGILPALVGAISDALGVPHIDMPATPERVWRAARSVTQ